MACTPQGTGATLTWATNALSLRVIAIEENWSLERPRLDDSGLDTTNYLKYCPGSLVDHGIIVVQYAFDKTVSVAKQFAGIASTVMLDAAEVITLQHPTGTPSAGSDDWILSGTGFMVNANYPSFRNNELSFGTYGFTFDNDTTPPTITAPS